MNFNWWSIEQSLSLSMVFHDCCSEKFIFSFRTIDLNQERKKVPSFLDINYQSSCRVISSVFSHNINYHTSCRVISSVFSYILTITFCRVISSVFSNILTITSCRVISSVFSYIFTLIVYHISWGVISSVLWY